MNTYFLQNLHDLPPQFQATYLWSQQEDFIFWENPKDFDFNLQKKWPTRKSWVAEMDYDSLSCHLTSLQSFFEKKTPLVTQFSLSISNKHTFHVRETLSFMKNKKNTNIIGQVTFRVDNFEKNQSSSMIPQPDTHLQESINFLTQMHQPIGLHIFIVESLSPDKSDLQRILNKCIQPFLRYQEQVLRTSNDTFLLVQHNATYPIFEKLKTQIKETLCHTIFQWPLIIEHECMWLSPNDLGVVTKEEIEGLFFQTYKTSQKKIVKKLNYYQTQFIKQGNVAEKELLERYHLAKKLIEQDQLTLSFQPIVNAKTNCVEYYETLVRAIDEQGNVIPPGQFLSVCETLQIIEQLDMNVLKFAIQQLMTHVHLKISINVSAITANNSSWLQYLKFYNYHYPELSKRMIVEITESAFFQDTYAFNDFIQQLHDIGFAIAIDDFGEGYMSFDHLKDRRAKILKIDGQYIKNIHTNIQNQSIVRALVEITRAHNLECVAECVETKEEADVLMDLGIYKHQGYFYQKPSFFVN